MTTLHEMRTMLHKLYRFIFPAEEASLVKRQFGLPDTLNLTFKLTQDGWFVVTSPELPGFITQAKDYKELIEMINDAVLTYFDVPKRTVDIVYDRINIGNTEVTYQAVLQTP